MQIHNIMRRNVASRVEDMSSLDGFNNTNESNLAGFNSADARNLDFVNDMRSMSALDNLSDFTIQSGNVNFPCYRLLLAARSKYFEAMFRHEPEKKILKMEESPEVVKAMLDYISKGCIPADIVDKAVDMVLMCDMYDLDLLTTACQTSMVNNLSAENAVETLIIIDMVKHVSKLEHRQKILAFIKKEVAQVVQSNNWELFVRNYPNLVTEIILSLASS